MSGRVKYFDIAKGVAILCIIAGHMGNPTINRFVFTFHVPIFFLISGYFLKNNISVKDFIKKKYRQLIIPYIITSICIIVGVSLGNIIRTHGTEYLVEDVKTWVIASLYGSGTIEYTSPFYMKQIGAIWFLPALFFAFVIVRYFIDYEHGWIAIVLLAYVGYKTRDMVWLPLSIQAGMTASVFIYIGWVAKKYKLFERDVSPVIIGGTTCIWLFSILFCGEFYLVQNYFGNGMFDVIGAVAGSYLVILFCKEIERKSNRIAKILQFYGKNTLLILCLHAAEMVIISWDWVWQLGVEKLDLQNYQIVWIILVLKVVLFTFGIYVIEILKNIYLNVKSKIREKIELKKQKTLLQRGYSDREGRIKYWDIAKGIAIMLMILGHTDIPEYLHIIIFSFHMPLFMIINGYFIKNHNIKRTFTRSVKTLLVPYMTVCLLSAGIYAFIGWKAEGRAVELLLYKIKAMLGGMSKISTRFLTFDSVWVVWLVCCLFLARNIYVILMNLSEKYHFIYPWGILLLAFFGYLVGEYYAFMPWSLDVALVSLVFIGVGNWLRREDFFSKSYCYTLVIPAAIWIYFMRMGIAIELATRSYPLGIFSILEAIAGSITVIAVAKLLNKSKLMTGVISWIGENSMIILGIHCLELMYFNWNEWIFKYLPFSMNWFREFVIKSILILLLTSSIVVLKKVLLCFRAKRKL